MQTVIGMLGAMALLAGCATQVPVPPLPETAIARSTAFLDALRSRDEDALHRLTGLSWTKGDLDPQEESYIFGPADWPGGGRPLREIAQAADIVVVVKPSGDPGQGFAYFIPARFTSKIGDVAWLEDNFLKAFFVCRFELRDELWVPLDHFCYAEQDNPFSPPYG